MSPQKGRVVLFKTPPEADAAGAPTPDPYSSVLTQHGLTAEYIPVLDHWFDTVELESVIRGAESSDGIIITSKRGADAWVRAVRRVTEGFGGKTVQSPSWSNVPLYTVGHTSIDVLKAASADPTLSRLIPNAPGLTARSASDLIPALLARASEPTLSANEPIVSRAHTHPDRYTPKRFLFVRGDKSLETIQPALRNAGHTVREVEVYRTGSLASLQQDIDNAFSPAAVEVEHKQPVVWLALFSPSSAQYVLDRLPPRIVSAISATASSDGDGVVGSSIRVAAIGDTTRAFLQQHGIRVDAVARTPDAAGLAAAISSSTPPSAR